MTNFIESLLIRFLSSIGLKRRLASFVALALNLAPQVPELAPAIPLLQYLGTLLDVTGVAHANAAGTTFAPNAKAITIASYLRILIQASAAIPALQPYVGLLNTLAVILSAFGLGVASIASK